MSPLGIEPARFAGRRTTSLDVHVNLGLVAPEKRVVMGGRF